MSYTGPQCPSCSKASCASVMLKQYDDEKLVQEAIDLLKTQIVLEEPARILLCPVCLLHIEIDLHKGGSRFFLGDNDVSLDPSILPRVNWHKVSYILEHAY